MTDSETLALILQRLTAIEELLQAKKKPKSTPAASTQLVHRGKVVGTYPTVGSGGKEFAVYQQDVIEWQETYPGVDVVQQLKEAKAWLVASPRRQKTHSGMPRFLNTWLSKEQNKGGHHGTHQQHQYQTRSDRNIQETADFIRRNRQTDIDAGGGSPSFSSEADGGLFERTGRLLS